MTLATVSTVDRTQMREVRGLAREIKFVVTPAIAHEIREWARATLAADLYGHGPHGDEYRTTSLYFDTPDFDVFHRQGSFGRAKYRVRRYGLDDVVFLERKMRTKAMLAKRRTNMPLHDLLRVECPIGERWSGSWFAERIAARNLGPVCQVSYSRTARVGMTNDGPIRLTLDEQLSALDAVGFAFRHERGRTVVERAIILEMKYRSTVPVIFRELVEAFRLTPRPVSKYRLSLAALRNLDLTQTGHPGIAELQLACA
jgi:VTC domain-containing protein